MHGCSSFSVGDAIKDVLGNFSVWYFSGNGMGSDHLVFPVPPSLSEVELDGDTSELLGFELNVLHAVMRDEIGIGLVKPEVVPPFHGDIITEPMVGHFVSDGVGQCSVPSDGDFLLEEIEIVEGDASWVFHGSPVVLGDEDGIVFAELVGHAEELFVELHALDRDFEDEILHSFERLFETFPAIEGEGDVVVLLFALVLIVVACNEREQIRGQVVGLGELPQFVLV